MKKINRLLFTIFAFSTFVSAQEKLISVDDIFNPDPAKRVRFGGTPIAMQWTHAGDSFKQMQAGKLMRVDVLTGKSTDFFESAKLEAALINAGVKAGEAKTLANSGSLHFNEGETAILINNASDLWLYDVRGGTLKRLTNSNEEEKEEDFSPNGKWISFVRGNNLFVVDAATAREKQLTRDGREGDKAIYNGYLDWLYEEELYGRGQKRGYWWSPDSRFIAFLRLDESPVPKFVLTNDAVTDQVVENTDYPKAGDPNPLVKLGVADVKKSSVIPNVGRVTRVAGRIAPAILRFGDLAKFADLRAYKPEDLLIARVAWTPDSSHVVFQALNREQTFLDVNAMSRDGSVKKLLTETTPAWVEVYDNPVFFKDGTAIWQSARDGWKHLYYYDKNCKLIRRLTQGNWEVRSLHGVDETAGWVYFSATKDSHIAENIYRVKASGGEIERLTEGDGWHAAVFNSNFTYFLENRSDINTPAQTRLLKADGTLVRVINENKVELLKEYKLGTPEFLKVKTRDGGFEMEALMIKPPDFDPSKKYPVFSFNYSGPHAPSVANRWGGNRYMWFHMLAQKGYIVWVCDNRTASGKGEISTWPVYKQMGVLELRDLEDGIAYLKSLSYVDGERIGLHGWSYGGFMTSFALTHSKTFKIGIAGGIVSDWRLYDSIYTERYMLTPQNNPDGYDRTSVIKAAKNLHGRLLLIHGVMDDNVHMQNAIQLAHELQKEGKQFDLMVYPTQRHGITNPAQVRHWYQMMTDFILRNL